MHGRHSLGKLCHSTEKVSNPYCHPVLVLHPDFWCINATFPRKGFPQNAAMGSHHVHLTVGTCIQADLISCVDDGKLTDTDFWQFVSPWEDLLAADRSLCPKWSIWLLTTIILSITVHAAGVTNPSSSIISSQGGDCALESLSWELQQALWAARRLCCIWLLRYITEIIPVWFWVLVWLWVFFIIFF